MASDRVVCIVRQLQLIASRHCIQPAASLNDGTQYTLPGQRHRHFMTSAFTMQLNLGQSLLRFYDEATAWLAGHCHISVVARWCSATSRCFALASSKSGATLPRWRPAENNVCRKLKPAPPILCFIHWLCVRYKLFLRLRFPFKRTQGLEWKPGFSH